MALRAVGVGWDAEEVGAASPLTAMLALGVDWAEAEVARVVVRLAAAVAAARGLVGPEGPGEGERVVAREAAEERVRRPLGAGEGEAP